MLAFCASRAQSIRELALSFDGEEHWQNIACLLGMISQRLRRLALMGECCTCELPERSTTFLWHLRGLTSLRMESCLDCLPRAVSRLTNLRELLLRQKGLTLFSIPDEIAELHQLTRLELVRCRGELPLSMSRLTGLRLLNLDGNDLLDNAPRFATFCLVLHALTNLEVLSLAECDLPDVPDHALSSLTGLTALTLTRAFSRRFGPGWETKLDCLSCLSSLRSLDLGGIEMAALPRSLTGLTRLSMLDCGMVPLSGTAGLPDGPYLEGLCHLNIRGAAFSSLPQHLTHAQQLTFLGLSCCHDLWLSGSLAKGVLGQLSSLRTLTLCDQMMHSVDSARCMHALGRLLPGLEIVALVESDDEDEDEDEEDEDESVFSTEDEDGSESEYSDSEEGDSPAYTEEEEEESDWESHHGNDDAAVEGEPGGAEPGGAAGSLDANVDAAAAAGHAEEGAGSGGDGSSNPPSS